MEAVSGASELTEPGVGPGGLTDWQISVDVGSAAAFHARDLASAPTRHATWFSVDRPALVIGSAQPLETIDLDACAVGGFEVVRRRSGGGAVLMVPGEIIWLDVWIGRHDPLWSDDIGRSMWWLGDAWASALASLGQGAGASAGAGADACRVHRGALVSTEWSRTVCFDGVGSGEVLVGDAKAVGISQRRTRHGARLQSAVHVRWAPDRLRSLLAEPRPEVDALRSVWCINSEPVAIRSAVERFLPR